MNLSTAIRLPTAALIMTVVAACARETGPLELTGYTMGTTYSVRITDPESVPLDDLRDRITARLEELEGQFSTYQETSEVSRFNAQTGEDWFAISPQFLEILTRGLSISQLSHGAFDVTVGPLVELWGFGASGPTQTLPSQGAIDKLLAATGSDYLEIRESPPALRRVRPGVQVDLSAIAKGFAVDSLWTLLDQNGLTNYMVEIGGEVRTRGRRADGGDWVIGVESPLLNDRLDDESTALQNIVYLRDRAIATSGDYRNYFEHQGQRYSHTLDPRTGWPVSHQLAAVTVISQTAATADALATALMVMGPESGFQLAQREGLIAQLIVRTDAGLQVLQTPAYQAYLDSR